MVACIPVWMPVWYTVGGAVCVVVLLWVWFCTGVVILSGGHALLAAVWMYDSIRSLLSRAVNRCFGAHTTHAMQLRAVPTAIAAPNDSDAAGSGGSGGSGGAESFKRTSPAPPDPPSAGATVTSPRWQPSLPTLRERSESVSSSASDQPGATFRPIPSQSVQPTADRLSAAASFKPLQLLWRCVLLPVVAYRSLSERVSAGVQFCLCRVEWEKLELDLIGLRIPYTYIQDMRLEVHRLQLALGWRTDKPSAFDYPNLAVYHRR